jgi:hypothetical protein
LAADGFFAVAESSPTYDPVHNRTQRTAAGVDERLGFDAANQLVEMRNSLARNDFRDSDGPGTTRLARYHF